MMVNKKTKFPTQALLAMATFLKTFHHALDNVDANLKDLPVLRPAKATVQGSAASPNASNASAFGPFVLPNRQVSLLLACKSAALCSLPARASWRPQDRSAHTGVDQSSSSQRRRSSCHPGYRGARSRNSLSAVGTRDCYPPAACDGTHSLAPQGAFSGRGLDLCCAVSRGCTCTRLRGNSWRVAVLNHAARPVAYLASSGHRILCILYHLCYHLRIVTICASYFACNCRVKPRVARWIDRARYLNSPQASAAREAARKDRLRQRPWVDESDAVLSCLLLSCLSLTPDRARQRETRGERKRERHRDGPSLALAFPSIQFLCLLCASVSKTGGTRPCSTQGHAAHVALKPSPSHPHFCPAPLSVCLPPAVPPAIACVPLSTCGAGQEEGDRDAGSAGADHDQSWHSARSCQ